MAQWVRRLLTRALHEHTDLCSKPQHQHQKPSMAAHICNCSIGVGGVEMENHRGLLATSLEENDEPRFSETTCLKGIR